MHLVKRKLNKETSLSKHRQNSNAQVQRNCPELSETR
jgi:hypothetical protein